MKKITLIGVLILIIASFFLGRMGRETTYVYQPQMASTTPSIKIISVLKEKEDCEKVGNIFSIYSFRSTVGMDENGEAIEIPEKTIIRCDTRQEKLFEYEF